MYKVLVLSFLFLFAQTTLAHQPTVVSPQSVDEVIAIEDPNLSQAFYGELKNFPHTYEIRSDESFLLYVQILEPDSDKDKASNIHSGLIVRERDTGRGVEEVIRLPASASTWEAFYEPFGGDSYLAGPEFEKEVTAGVYRIEVSTSENSGKYVLSVGKIEDFSNIGYFESIKHIYEVKRFLGKSPFAILQTPFVYVPALIILLIAGFIIWYRKKYYA